MIEVGMDPKRLEETEKAKLKGVVDMISLTAGDLIAITRWWIDARGNVRENVRVTKACIYLGMLEDYPIALVPEGRLTRLSLMDGIQVLQRIKDVLG